MEWNEDHEKIFDYIAAFIYLASRSTVELEVWKVIENHMEKGGASRGALPFIWHKLSDQSIPHHLNSKKLYAFTPRHACCTLCT